MERSHKMQRKSEACSDCTKNCLFVHKYGSSSSTVNRFFKLMHGKNYSEVLYLPPKFARAVRDLVGQVAQIEDSNGQKWYVTFSNVNSSLVLEEGWPEFYRDHDLKFGDLVVFNYMKKGHFVVHIYDSSACERMDFSPLRPRNYKRLRPNRDTALHHELFQAVDVDPTDKPNKRARSVSASLSQNGDSNHMETNILDRCTDLRNMGQKQTCINLEEPIYMLNRDTDRTVEDKNFWHNLSNFEKNITKSDTNSIEKSLDDAGLKTDEAQVIGGHYDNVNSIADMQDNVYKNQNDKTSGHYDNVTSIDVYENQNDKTRLEGEVMLTEVSKTPFISSTHVTVEENDFMAESFDLDDRMLTSVAKTPSTISTHVTEQENAFMTESFGLAYKQASAIKIKEIVESREKPLPSSVRAKASEQGNAFVQKLPGFSLLSATPEDFSATAMNMELNQKVATSANEFSNITSSMPYNAPATHYAAIVKEIMEPREKKGMSSANAYASPHISSMPYNVPGKLAATVKKEIIEPRRDVYGFPLASSPTVKTEPGLSYDIGPIAASSFFISEVKSVSYLEVPVRIPFSPQNASVGQGRVVFLRDATRRSWPVLYHILFCMRAFTQNWKSFCKANNVKLGDVCIFQMESLTPCSYRVDVHRPGLSFAT